MFAGRDSVRLHRLAVVVLHFDVERKGNRMIWASFQPPESFQHVTNIVQCDVDSLLDGGKCLWSRVVRNGCQCFVPAMSNQMKAECVRCIFGPIASVASPF